MFRIDALTVRTPRGRTILDRVSGSARVGEVLAILGPNGAGKTTLLEGASGLIESSGTVSWNGSALHSFADRARVLALMPDDADLPEELTVRELLGRADPKSLGLEPLLDRSAGTLSRGEAKRVWLAQTLAEDRPVFLLDEPFGAFDPVQLDDVLAVVRERARAGAAVVATIHQMTSAEKIADRILLLAGGRAIAEGTLDELRARGRVDGAERSGAPEAIGGFGGRKPPNGVDGSVSLEAVFRKLVAERDDPT